MRAIRSPHRRTFGAFPAVAFILLFTVLTACGSDDTNGPSADTTSFTGALAGTGGLNGSLAATADGVLAPHVASPAATLSLAAAAPADVLNLTATATLSDGSTVTLTGTWNTVTGALTMSGGGFAFTGTYVDGTVSGTFTGPEVTGVFSLQVESTTGEVAVYCGTYTGRQPEDFPGGGTGTAPDNGTWNLIVGATAVDAIILTESGDAGTVTGTRSGNTLTLTVPAGTATGTLKGTGSAFVAGTYNIPGSSTGTFQGSTVACTATAESATIQSIVINNPGIVSGSQSARLAYDSTLVFATAYDAQGNYVAAPDLEWSYTGAVRSNTEVTPRGQKWFAPLDLGSSSVKVTSKNNTSATATAVVIIQ